MELNVSKKGKYTVIAITGKVDWEGARRLDAELQAIIADGTHHLVFDLDRISFLCSGAIGALTHNINKIRHAQGSFFLVCTNDYVRSVFQTLRFDEVFKDQLLQSLDELDTQDNPPSKGSTSP